MPFKTVWTAQCGCTWQERQQLLLQVFCVFSSSRETFCDYSCVFDPSWKKCLVSFSSYISNHSPSVSKSINDFTLRSYSTYVPFWQWKSAAPRKRWPTCWMMQWTHTSPLCMVCLWVWSTLRSWTLTSSWRLSKSILQCVQLRYDREIHHWWAGCWSLNVDVISEP